MSDFVPMRDAGDFRSGLVPSGKEPGTPVSQEVEMESELCDVAEDAAAVELPDAAAYDRHTGRHAGGRDV